MSEILRSIACSLIIVISSMTFTHSALSMDDDNIFGERFLRHQSAGASFYTAHKTSKKKVYRKTAVKKKRYKKKRVVSRKTVHRQNKNSRRVVRRKKAVYRRAKYRKTIARKRVVKRVRKVVAKQYRKKRYVKKVAYRSKVTTQRRARLRVSGKSRFSSLIAKHASNYGVPLRIAHAVVRIESNYRPGVRGGAGEIGLMQIKPATARMMGYRGSTRALYNPDTNLKYGMKYLAGAYRRSGGSICGTVLRYNAGHGAKRMNPISARYCRKAKRIIGRSH